MRELHQNEIVCINGGINTKGYNFSFIVENTVTGALIGIPFAVLAANANVVTGMAAIFGTYAIAMTVAKGLDTLFFDAPAINDTYVPPATNNVVIV